MSTYPGIVIDPCPMQGRLIRSACRSIVVPASGVMARWVAPGEARDEPIETLVLLWQRFVVGNQPYGVWTADVRPLSVIPVEAILVLIDSPESRQARL